MPRGLAPLRHRGFALLAAGQLASNLGDAFYAVALPWYVLADHGGPLLLGAVLAAYGIPRTVLLAVGGHASDRLRPWTVMLGADGVRAVAVGALAGVTALGPAHPYLLVPIAVVLGAGEGLFVPGSFAIVPALLGGEDLQAGNALTSGATQLATFVGPAVGGLVVALLGPAPAFAVDAVSFTVSAVTLGGVRRIARAAAPQRAAAALERAPGSATRAPTLRQLLAREPVLVLLLVVDVAANLGSGGTSEVALPALARGPLHAGAAGYGSLVAVMGGGLLVGTVVAAQARRARRPMLAASLALLAAAPALAVVPYLGGTIGAGVALVVFGAVVGFSNVVTITALQRWAPAELMGRLMGLVMLSGMGIFPVSVLLGGVVVHGLGAAPFFPMAAAVLLAATVATLTRRSWREFGSVSTGGKGSSVPAGSGRAPVAGGQPAGSERNG